MKKKGFTLIELLAVIVILAIIALIAVPVIMNIIASARESAFEDTAYGIIKAGELYYANALLNDGMTSDAEFTFTEGAVSPEGLSIQGSLPQSGKLVVTRDGKTAIAISNGTYCITKEYEESKITTTDEFETCDLPAGRAKTLSKLAKTNDFAESVDACATSGTCTTGTKFAIEVAPGNIQNFYVVSDENNTVTLLMNKNIGETMAWINETDYLNAGGNQTDWNNFENMNVYGPITALNYLESQTNDWTNIEAKNYVLTDSVYGTMTRTNVRARMLTLIEANAISSYDWSYGNLYDNIFAYWLSSASENYSSDASAMFDGSVGSRDVGNGDNFGVRPVIELSK